VISFGLSSRLYIVGMEGSISAPEDEIKLGVSSLIEKPEDQENHKMNLKAQYLKLLEKNSYKVKPKSKPELPLHHDNSIISWGMVDEGEIYAYEDEEDFKLDPELLRQLPNLTSKDLEKIDNFEKKLSKYKGVEKDLNQLLKRENEEFGLSEADKNKKAQLETKVNEVFNELQIQEDNLRFALFDEVREKRNNLKIFS
jgi:hypothetical protein